MSDSSSSAAASGGVPVVVHRALPFDDGLAETQPLELEGLNPTREEKLP